MPVGGCSVGLYVLVIYGIWGGFDVVSGVGV